MSELNEHTQDQSNQLALISIQGSKRFYVIYPSSLPITGLNSALYKYLCQAKDYKLFTTTGGDRPVTKFKSSKENLYYLEVGEEDDNITAEDETQILSFIESGDTFLIGTIKCKIYDSQPDDKVIQDTVELLLKKNKVNNSSNRITLGDIGIRIQPEKPEDKKLMSMISLDVVVKKFLVNVLRMRKQNTTLFPLLTSGMRQNVIFYDGEINGKKQFGIFCKCPVEWCEQLKNCVFQYVLPDKTVVSLIVKVIDNSIIEDIIRMNSYYSPGPKFSVNKGFNQRAYGEQGSRNYRYDSRSADADHHRPSERSYNRSGNTDHRPSERSHRGNKSNYTKFEKKDGNRSQNVRYVRATNNPQYDGTYGGGRPKQGNDHPEVMYVHFK